MRFAVSTFERRHIKPTANHRLKYVHSKPIVRTGNRNLARLCADRPGVSPAPQKDTPMLKEWPLLKQIKGGFRGTGPEVMSERTRNLKMKTSGAEVTQSVCPYCGVGCGQLIHHKNGKLISIEGDPQSPISRGHLCPKGADTYELHTHPNRLKRVKYRAPYAKE